MDLDALVAPLRSDAIHGAAVVAGRAAVRLRRAARGIAAADVAAFRSVMAQFAAALLDAQPAMAPLVELARRTLIAVDAAPTLATAKTAAADAAREFERDLAYSSQATARQVLAVIPASARILTLSSSSTVLAALQLAIEQRTIQVTCLEGRPRLEGRRMARALANGGIPVRLAVDAAVGVLVAQSDLVLVGADSVGDRGIVNKIGTCAAALVARFAGVPVYVLADKTKFLPPGFPQITDRQAPPGEVWRRPAHRGPHANGRLPGERTGVDIWNGYFEAVPLDLITGIVSEDGVLEPGAVVAQRAALPVPPALRAWVRKRHHR